MTAAPKAWEVWLKRDRKPWTIIANKESTNGNWPSFKEAEKVARSSASEEDAVEVVVIERIPVLRMNGKIHGSPRLSDNGNPA